MEAREILKFWYDDAVRPMWFNSTTEFDNELKSKYSELVDSAAKGELDTWKNSAEGCLALCIILDQFPLNMYRGQAQSFATEHLAREVSTHAVNAGFDSALSGEQKLFLYMPFMHSENIDDQNTSVELFEKAGMSDNVRYAIHHREIIIRFGRFPHRNEALGRESRPDELEYLASPEAFHG